MKGPARGKTESETVLVSRNELPSNILFSSYGQIYTAPFYRQEYPMKFDGEYDLQDGLGTPVKATASDNCDEIEIIAEGGNQGQQITRLVLNSETGELKMYMTLKEHDVTAARIFQIDTKEV